MCGIYNEMGTPDRLHRKKSWMVSLRHDDETPEYLIKRHRYLSFDANRDTFIDETEYYEVKRISCIERFMMMICCEGDK